MLGTAAASSASIPPSEWLYILAAVGTLIATAVGIRSGWSKYVKQRQKEAVDNADLHRAILGNVKATQENTQALTKLAQDFHDFAVDTRASLNGHAERIGRLESPRN